MFSAILRRMRISPTTMIATLALVFAMTGGAYAAKKYLITSTKQISPKVLKSLQGKAGPAGQPGANGLAGPAGSQGPAGAAGAKGETGAVGSQGPKGETGATGAAGKNGETGFTETLPKEKTETGAWALPPTGTSEPGSLVVVLSFSIPLEKALGETQVHYVGSNGDGASCPGTVASPTAEPGNLCVYEAFNLGLTKSGSLPLNAILPADFVGLAFKQGAATSGALVRLVKHESEEASAYGTWAVTAP